MALLMAASGSQTNLFGPNKVTVSFASALATVRNGAPFTDGKPPKDLALDVCNLSQFSVIARNAVGGSRPCCRVYKGSVAPPKTLRSALVSLVQTRREGAEHHSRHELSRTCTSVSRKMRFHRSNPSLTASAAAGRNITPSDRSRRSFKVFSQQNRAHFSLVMGSSIKPDPWGDSRQRGAAASAQQRQSLGSGGAGRERSVLPS